MGLSIAMGIPNIIITIIDHYQEFNYCYRCASSPHQFCDHESDIVTSIKSQTCPKANMFWADFIPYHENLVDSPVKIHESCLKSRLLGNHKKSSDDYPKLPQKTALLIANSSIRIFVAQSEELHVPAGNLAGNQRSKKSLSRIAGRGKTTTEMR